MERGNTKRNFLSDYSEDDLEFAIAYAHLRETFLQSIVESGKISREENQMNWMYEKVLKGLKACKRSKPDAMRSEATKANWTRKVEALLEKLEELIARCDAIMENQQTLWSKREGAFTKLETILEKDIEETEEKMASSGLFQDQNSGPGYSRVYSSENMWSTKNSFSKM